MMRELTDSSAEQDDQGEGAPVSTERQDDTAALEFMTTLDTEQKQAFEGIFSPARQEEIRKGDNYTSTRYGAVPRELDPMQRSVYALIEAETSTRRADALPEGDGERDSFLQEAAALREHAAQERQAAEQ